MFYRQGLDNGEASVMTSACYHVCGGGSRVLLYSEVLESNAQANLVSVPVQLWCKANVFCR